MIGRLQYSFRTINSKFIFTVFLDQIMSDEEAYATLKHCYDLLRSKCPANSELDQATNWLDQFYQTPLSIQCHVNFYNESTDIIDRLHSIIGLSKSIRRTWDSVTDDSKSDVFHMLLDMITREVDWINRRNIIDIVSMIFAPEYSQLLLNFVKDSVEKNNVAYLEIAVSLSTFLPENLIEIMNDPSIAPFFYSMIELGFQTEQPEVRLATIQFINENKFLDTSAETHPEYWEQCVITLAQMVTRPILLPRYVTVINHCLSQGTVVTDPIPLLSCCLSYFASPTPDENLLMKIHPIIQNICHNYQERVVNEEEVCVSLMQLYIQTSMRLFDPADQFILSNANFFEQTFTDLCINPDIATLMWEMCSEVAESQPGLFVFARTLSATFNVATEFYLDKFENISSVLRAGISSDSQLLRDACAQSADDFATCFVFETDELSFGFLEDVQNAVQENPSAELLTTLAYLFDATKKTDDIFDSFFQFLISIVQLCDAETIQPALQCLSNLAKWSTLKIFEHYSELFDILGDIIHSSADALEHLKGPAIECISKVAVTIGSSFDEYVPVLFPEFIDGLENPDLMTSCLTALEEIISSYIEREQYEDLGDFFSRILPFISEHAKIDYTAEYENIDKVEGAPFPPQFALSASSLKLLSSLLITDQTFYDAYLQEVLDDCIIQSNSCSPNCQIASMTALAKIASIPNLPSPEVEEQIMQVAGELTLKLTSIGNNIDVAYNTYESVSLVIQCIDITKMDDLLDQIIIQVKQNLEDPQTISKRPQERGRDLFDAINTFLCAVCQSTSGAIEKLTPLMDIYIDFLNYESLRFRSLALSLFSELIRFDPGKFPEELKQRALECALQMASDEIDASCFSFLDRLALNEPNMLEPIAASTMSIFLDKLNPEKDQKLERYILMRDKCIKCFGTFLMKHIFPEDSYNIEEIIPICLAAMPIQLDFGKKESDRVADFFFWLYERSGEQFDEQFLRVLVVEFSNHPSIIESHQYSAVRENKMRKTCVRLYTKLPNAARLVESFLDNDQLRLANFQSNLSDTNPEEEESVPFPLLFPSQQEEFYAEEEEEEEDPPRTRYIAGIGEINLEEDFQGNDQQDEISL